MIDDDDNNKECRAHLYRSLLQYSKVFLTELPRRESRSASVNESINSDVETPLSPLNSSIQSTDPDHQLFSTRKRCQQRLGVCARKKLSLLTFQEQNDKQHEKFQKFIDDSNTKRSKSLREYQIQLKDHLLKRLEGDQLKRELLVLNQQKFLLDQEKKRYLPIQDLLERAIPLFPSGSLPTAVNDCKSIIARFRSLSELKKSLEHRDYQREKNELLKRKEEFVRDHDLQMTQLGTKHAQLHNHLIQLEYEVHNQEQKLLFQINLRRTRTTTIGQLEATINSLYERHQLAFEKRRGPDLPLNKKMKSIQDFILYRTDLLHRMR